MPRAEPWSVCANAATVLGRGIVHAREQELGLAIEQREHLASARLRSPSVMRARWATSSTPSGGEIAGSAGASGGAAVRSAAFADSSIIVALPLGLFGPLMAASFAAKRPMPGK